MCWFFIADFGDESHSGGEVLRQARPMRLISPTLLVAFEAASLLFVGKHYKQRDCEVAGNAKYQIALSMLRNDLQDEYKTLSSHATCLISIIWRRLTMQRRPNPNAHQQLSAYRLHLVYLHPLEDHLQHRTMTLRKSPSSRTRHLLGAYKSVLLSTTWKAQSVGNLSHR